MDEYTYDPAGTQPTTQQPAQPTAQQPSTGTAQPGYQDGYQRGAQAGYEAGFHAGQTAQQPRVSPDASGAFAGNAGTSASTAAGSSAPAGSASWNGGTVPPIPGQQPGLAPTPDDGKKPKREHRGAKALILGIAGGVLGAGLLTGVLLGTGVIGRGGSATFNTGTNQSITINPSDENTSTATAVAAKALPSVCTVTVTTSDGTGEGSGVIYDNDGDIITNNHVIEDAESISVTINGQNYDATLVGTDASSDVAVVKVDLQGAQVTPIEVGDSAALQVGDWVMSIGSPFGFEQSVSQGIVSALTRNQLLQNSSGNTLYTNLIQVDAAINPGNSGGALVNSKGQLVGICTLYSSDTQSFAGIGFAIPGNYATQVADKIIKGETVTHAHIGLSMQTVNAQNAKVNKLSVSQGAYVADVAENGPAANAGIQKGDIIIAMDDTQITSADAAILAVRSHNIGDTVKVTVMRGNDQKEFEVTLDDDSELQKQQQEQQSQPKSNINDYLQNNGDGSGNGYGDNSDFLEELQQYLNQRHNGYGDHGYGYGN